MNRSRFPGTRWSLVLRAGEGQKAALEELCKGYWYPLYAYVRRQRFSPEEAQDLTQGFFAALLAREDFATVRKKGRFRSYLLASLSNFLNNERDRANALKRGGGQAPLSLDWLSLEGRYLIEASDPRLNAEKMYERQWTLTLLERVMDHLRDGYREAGKEALFEALAPYMTDGGSAADYERIGEQLGMTGGAVKVALHRMRKRYGEALRDEVADTVGDLAAVEDEIKYLMSTL